MNITTDTFKAFMFAYDNADMSTMWRMLCSMYSGSTCHPYDDIKITVERGTGAPSVLRSMARSLAVHGITVDATDYRATYQLRFGDYHTGELSKWHKRRLNDSIRIAVFYRIARYVFNRLCPDCAAPIDQYQAPGSHCDECLCKGDDSA